MFFNVGFPKSGTVSLHYALQMLGLKSHHNYAEVESDLDGVAKRYDAIIEIPVRMFDEVVEQYPNAKYLFTYRDVESYITSTMTHILNSRIRNTSNWREINTHQLRQDYQQHSQKVREFFVYRESQFLPIDICAGQGWEILCPFIGADIPDAPFPKVHTGKSKLLELIHYV